MNNPTIKYILSKKQKNNMLNKYYENKEKELVCLFCREISNVHNINKHLKTKKCIELQKIKQNFNVNNDTQLKELYNLYINNIKKIYKYEDKNDDTLNNIIETLVNENKSIREQFNFS